MRHVALELTDHVAARLELHGRAKGLSREAWLATLAQSCVQETAPVTVRAVEAAAGRLNRMIANSLAPQLPQSLAELYGEGLRRYDDLGLFTPEAGCD